MKWVQCPLTRQTSKFGTRYMIFPFFTGSPGAALTALGTKNNVRSAKR